MGVPVAPASPCEVSLNPKSDGPPPKFVPQLVELYTTKLDTPCKAAPVLARMAEEVRGTREGLWASAELRRIRLIIAAEADRR